MHRSSECVISTYLISFNLYINFIHLQISVYNLRWKELPRYQSSWGQHGAHLGPVGPRWAPCWLHEPCYQDMFTSGIDLIRRYHRVITAPHHCAYLRSPLEVRWETVGSRMSWVIAIMMPVMDLTPSLTTARGRGQHLTCCESQHDENDMRLHGGGWK